MRGENGSRFDCYSGLTGTSPRARGKRQKGLSRNATRRNIPACAGKTHAFEGFAVIAMEHPRVRGENMVIAAFTEAAAGTSPRARGKLGLNPHAWRVWRNIPACAGKTCAHGRIRTGNAEHPRVRGENSSFFF